MEFFGPFVEIGGLKARSAEKYNYQNFGKRPAQFNATTKKLSSTKRPNLVLLSRYLSCQ
jgi:hypothetical protein